MPSICSTHPEFVLHFWGLEGTLSDWQWNPVVVVDCNASANLFIMNMTCSGAHHLQITLHRKRINLQSREICVFIQTKFKWRSFCNLRSNIWYQVWERQLSLAEGEPAFAGQHTGLKGERAFFTPFPDKDNRLPPPYCSSNWARCLIWPSRPVAALVMAAAERTWKDVKQKRQSPGRTEQSKI